MTLTINDRRVLEVPPAVVVFDLDNTLYAYEPAHRAAMAAIATKLSEMLNVGPDRFRTEFAVARQTVKERLGQTASAHNRLLYFQALLELLGLNAQVLLTLDLEQTYWRVFLANARLFDDAPGFIRDLRAAGVRTALLTDLTAQIQFRKLVYFGLDQQFEVVVTSEEAGADKPSPTMFTLLFGKLGIADTTGAWMLGDDATADIRGARAHGLATAQKIHAGVETGGSNEVPDIRFDHFIELRRLWKKCFDIGALPGRLSFGTAAGDTGHV